MHKKGNNMTYAEAKANLENFKQMRDEAEKKFELDHKNDKEFPAWSVFRDYMRPFNNAVVEAYSAMIPLIDDYKTEPFDSIGDYFTMEEFKGNCECGGFIDYDGSGVLCIGDKQTDITIFPSAIMKGADVSKFDGVMWYNK